MRVTARPSEELLRLWPGLTVEEKIARFRAMTSIDARDLFQTLETPDQADLLLSLTPPERGFWLKLLPPDDAADLIQCVPTEERRELLDQLDITARREITALLAYAEDAAGGLMNPRFARLRPEMTVDEGISYLRRQADEVETIYYGYVIDSDQRLLGVVSFRQLFSADRSMLVRDVMQTALIVVREGTDQEEIANLFSKHHLLAIPVVDGEGFMKGVVAVDDIVDVVEEEASEDIQKLGGMEALDEPYLRTRFHRMIRKRGTWLLVLFLGESLTATAMGHFENEVARAVVLAAFIPLIISSGGNSGSQAATLVIRAMALDEVRLSDWWRVVRRELAAGVVLGLMLAAVGMLRILAWQAIWRSYGEHYLLIASTVAASLVGVVVFGTLAGSMLPFALRRLGIDPATASAPFVATLVDVSGLVIYFSIAGALLRGTLL
jgi:magnesium transporter